MFSDFDKRMKRYEKSFTDIHLMDRLPVIVRVDGKAFHTFTRSFTKPFSDKIHDAMVNAAIACCKQMCNIKCAYTQSDETSFWLQQDNIESQGWFDWDIQKLASITASIYTYHFAKDLDCGPAYFDARSFNVPNDTELHNYFVWRQKDAERNSINALGQHYFSHKSLHGLNINQVQDRLMIEKSINWNDLQPWMKRGCLVMKNSEERCWSEVEAPIFTQKSILTFFSKEV